MLLAAVEAKRPASRRPARQHPRRDLVRRRAGPLHAGQPGGAAGVRRRCGRRHRRCATSPRGSRCGAPTAARVRPRRRRRCAPCAGSTVRNLEEIVRVPGSGELRHRLVNATPVSRTTADTSSAASASCATSPTCAMRRRLSRASGSGPSATSTSPSVMLVAIGRRPDACCSPTARPARCWNAAKRDVVGSNWFETSLPEAEREPSRMTFAQLMADNVPPWEYVENHVVTAGGRGAPDRLAQHGAQGRRGRDRRHAELR